MKNQKGITLIALILIIVVLLILAGVSISLVLSNEQQGKNNTFNEQDITNNVGFEEKMPEPEDDKEIGDGDSSLITTPINNNVADNTVSGDIDNEVSNEVVL